MTDADRSRGARALLQLPFALGAAAAFVASPAVGLVALTALAVAWPPAVPFPPVAWRSVLLRYVPFALLWFGFVVVYLRAMHALGHPVAPQPALVELAEHGARADGFALSVAAIVLLAPFFEELLFRGYLFTALEANRVPPVATQLVTAAAFGLVHGLGYALPIGVLALLFGWLRQRHGALLPAMLAHAVHNGVTVLVTLLWPAHLDLLYPS